MKTGKEKTDNRCLWHRYSYLNAISLTSSQQFQNIDSNKKQTSKQQVYMDP